MPMLKWQLDEEPKRPSRVQERERLHVLLHGSVEMINLVAWYRNRVLNETDLADRVNAFLLKHDLYDMRFVITESSVCFYIEEYLDGYLEGHLDG